MSRGREKSGMGEERVRTVCESETREGESEGERERRRRRERKEERKEAFISSALIKVESDSFFLRN